MKQLFTTTVLLFSATAFAQVGINNTSPKATLDITAKTTDGSKAEGLIIPQVAGDQIRTATASGIYGASQKGLIVYASSADSAPAGATVNITAPGYYYFDGSTWQKIVTGSSLNTSLASGNIYVGNASNVATALAPTGDVTISNTGVTSIGSGKVTSSQIADGTVANGDLASAAALTVKGNATNAAATPTDIAAGTDGYVLRRSGTALGFGTVATAGIADNAVTVAKLPSGASATTFLRGDGTWVTPTDTNTTYTAGTGLSLSGTTFSATDASTSAKGIVQLAGDLAGTAASPTVAKIQNKAVSSTAPSSGQVLKYNSTTSAWEPATDNDTNTTYTAGTGLSLSGTTFSATDASTSAKGIVQLAGDLAGTAASPTVAKIQNNAVSATAPTSGQVLGWNGTAWAPTANGISTTLNSGNILVGNASNVATAVTPSGDVTISNTGVTSIGAGKVTSTQIADGTVANADLSSGVGGIYKGDGALSGNTTVTQGTNTLAFTSTATTGTSHFTVDGSTFLVDAVNNRVGIGMVATVPKTNLHVSSQAGQTTPLAAFSIVNCGATCAQGTARSIVLNNIHTNNSLFASIDFVPGGDPTGNSGATIMGIDRDATNDYAGLSFLTRNASGYASRLAIKSSGSVGIGAGAESPNATLDVKAISSGTSPEGIIAPRLSLTALQGYTYGTNQTGAIVYVNSVASGTPTGQTANVTAVGYYFFDGTNWQKVASGNTLGTSLASGNIYVGNASGTATAVTPTGDVTISNTGVTSIGSGKVTSSQIADGTVANADLNTGVGGIYKGDGSLSGNTTVTQAANTLAFTSTATTGTSHFTVDGSTLNVDAANDRVGIGTSSPQTKLDIIGKIKITDGTQGANKILTSDANGQASWISSTSSTQSPILGVFPNPALNVDSNGPANTFRYSGVYIDLPQGKWIVYTSATFVSVGANGWVYAYLSSNQTSIAQSGFTHLGPSGSSSAMGAQLFLTTNTGVLFGSQIISVTAPSTRIYLVFQNYPSGTYTYITNRFENSFYALPIN